MSHATLSTNSKSETEVFSHVVRRVRQYVSNRRGRASASRELEAVLAGHHGVSMREELLAALNR